MGKAPRLPSAYFYWLVSLIDIGHGYYDLLEALSLQEFYEIVPNDCNREIDGLELRDEFSDFEINSEIPCTFLEMMVGLSRRLNINSMTEVDTFNPVGVWFWKLVENMELYECRDVPRSIKRVVERKYSEDGYGGLFPLNNPINDQRDVEIWYQMMAWLSEEPD